MRNIILGVTSSVAAIKALSLAAALKQFANVRIVLTQQSEYFIQSDYPALKALDIPLYRDSDEWPVIAGHYKVGEPILHIEMRRWADIFLIAPMDANTLAKMVNGLCDNLLTSIVRAWDFGKHLILCPAMNTMMWDNPPTADQIKIMKERGATIISPIEKKLACQDVGMGGMATVDEVVNFIKKLN
jgi:phosphopantothenoylcysteine decarboxylase